MQPLHQTTTMMQPALHRLAELAGLPRDWDSYGASPPASHALSAAYTLLFALEDRVDRHIGERLQPYAIAPIANGGVQLLWRGVGAEIEVDVDPSGSLGYLLIQGKDAARTFTEEESTSLLEVITVIRDVIDSSG